MCLKILEMVVQEIMYHIQVVIYVCQLNMKKVELERISDDDMYLFFEEGMKSGCFLYI